MITTITHIVRLVLTLWLLSLAYQETGIFTLIVLFLLTVNSEITSFVFKRMNEIAKLMVDLMEKQK